MDEKAADPLADFRKVNVAGRLNLARQAAHTGIRRFIFLSAIKVNGEQTFGIPFCESDVPAPQDAYSISKLEAEQGLMEVDIQAQALLRTAFQGAPVPIRVALRCTLR